MKWDNTQVVNRLNSRCMYCYYEVLMWWWEYHRRKKSAIPTEKASKFKGLPKFDLSFTI